MQWLVDGSVELTAICTAAGWKWKKCVQGLLDAGLTQGDAEVFAGWAFGTDAVFQMAVSDEALTDGEYARLSITRSVVMKHPVPPPG